MSRASLARNAPIPARYRLRTPTPPRTSSLIVVARGRRMRLELRHRGLHPAEPSAPSPETPTDPESSPMVCTSRTLLRTYTRMRPTEDHPTNHPVEVTGAAAEVSLPATDSSANLDSRVVVKPQGAGQRDGEVQDSYNSDETLDETPITGIHLGTGVFRLVNPSDLPIQIFDAPMSFEDFIHLRLQLDSGDGGLTRSQFRIMVGECTGCQRAMLIRSKDHHRCPGKHAPPTLVPQDELFSLLDSTAGGAGLTRNQFQRLFAECVICDLVFTREAACRHAHISHGDSDNSDNDLGIFF